MLLVSVTKYVLSFGQSFFCPVYRLAYIHPVVIHLRLGRNHEQPRVRQENPSILLGSITVL